MSYRSILTCDQCATVIRQDNFVWADEEDAGYRLYPPSGATVDLCGLACLDAWVFKARHPNE